MVIVGPAIGFGAIAALIVVFAAGYIFTSVVLEAIAERAAHQTSTRPAALNRDNVNVVAIVGGLIPVVVVILLFVNAPSESRASMAGLLTVLGFIVGGLSFLVPLLREDSTSTPPRQSQAKHQPPPSTVQWSAHEQPKYRPPHYQSSSSQTTSYQTPGYRTTPCPPLASSDPYRDLLAKARYDKDLAERLIDYERKRAPRASLDELCRSAIDRLERDNR